MPSIIDVKPPVYATARLGDCKNRNAKKAHPVIIKKNLSSIFMLLNFNSRKNCLISTGSSSPVDSPRRGKVSA